MEQPNLLYIKNLSGGDKAFEDKLISIIKKEYPQEKNIYLKNIKALNLEEAANNVHKLKHKISILGLEKSYEIANNFEIKLKDNCLDGQNNFEIILNTITRFLKTI